MTLPRQSALKWIPAEWLIWRGFFKYPSVLSDGVAFRMLKRLQREGLFPGNVDILILSAQHGLIRPNRKIAFYDQRMTQASATQQAACNVRFLRTFLHTGRYREAFVFAGQIYLTALHPVAGWLSDGVVLKIPKGGIGRKLQQAKRWLLSHADSRRL